MLNQLLFKRIDNSALIVFRIIFGLLCFLESIGAILTGWVKRTLVDPQFTFSFIGFEWLQPLSGNWMYLYYVVMGVFAFMVMIGYKYRFSIIAFTLMWLATYLMQKSSYNNHYYLLFLLSSIMIFLPANKYLSVDAKLNPNSVRYSMPKWCSLVFILQMFMVYTYASVAKIYPGWLDTSALEIILKGKQNYFLVGDFLQNKTLHYVLAYGGILFDGLIIPLLLFKSTRKWAFIISIFFHLFNSVIFQIGIFPYMSLAFSLFFFEPKTIHSLFLKKKTFYKENEVIIPKQNHIIISVFTIYFSLQLLLPLRHYAIKDNVLWTEEGHRLSWRMMLRTKHGYANYKVINKDTGKEIPITLQQFLTPKQERVASSKPDVIWQFSQYLKEHFKNQGQEVLVFVDARISVNGKPYKKLINSKVDLANTEWNAFKHSDWILPSNEE
ncbi:HTTM domain-containing protein [Yeosuana sp. MJ-SS3]|uniref:HTTM domain-containing protein n=1 Tax=Gilvirhabdus luticola TaxID=3079858 RepID=A0ABU3U8V1_9FLAO|nr:HTTM domain-containing protein [Yeosuana sp. MJ-SS3]MDU8886782.1 HTTM domain-containing protein [Yeosuana sp. MJ-SS3]